MVRLVVQPSGSVVLKTESMAVPATVNGPVELQSDAMNIAGTDFNAGLVLVDAASVVHLVDPHTTEFYQAIYLLYPLVIVFFLRSLLRAP